LSHFVLVFESMLQMILSSAIVFFMLPFDCIARLMNTKAIFLLSLPLLLPVTLAAEDLGAADSVDTWHWDWLNQLVENVTFPIQDIHESIDGSTIDLTNGYCNKLYVGGMDVSLNDSMVLFVSAVDLRLACHFDYKVKYKLLHISGTMDAELSDSSISGAMAIAYQDLLPVSTSLIDCTSDLIISVLKFSGSITGEKEGEKKIIL
jgi:hypothetical protein